MFLGLTVLDFQSEACIDMDSKGGLTDSDVPLPQPLEGGRVLPIPSGLLFCPVRSSLTAIDRERFLIGVEDEGCSFLSLY